MKPTRGMPVKKVEPEELADLQRGGVVGRRGLINGLLGLILRLRLGFGRGSLLSFVCKERAAGGTEFG